MLEAIDAAAEVLGNTRTVARAHYVHPHVLSSFTDGTFAAHLKASKPGREPLLGGSERRMIAFLKKTLEADLDASALSAG